jgi:hypothetical protein
VSGGGSRCDEVRLMCARVWNLEKMEARFVEVKGPGDSLSETQKASSAFSSCV